MIDPLRIRAQADWYALMVKREEAGESKLHAAGVALLLSEHGSENKCSGLMVVA